MTDRVLSSSGGWVISAAGAVVLVVLSAAVYLVVVRPAIQRAVSQQALTDQIAALRIAGAKQAATLQNIRRTVEQNRADLLRCDVHLQPAEQINQRLSLLADFAQRDGLTLDMMRPGPAQAHPYYRTVPITLESHCTYPQGAAFFHELVGQLSDMGVQNFSFTRAENDPAGRGLLRVELTWYTAPASSGAIQDAGSADAPLLTEGSPR